MNQSKARRFSAIFACSTALFVALGIAGCAADATGTTDVGTEKAPAAATAEHAAPPNSVEAYQGWSCTAAACTAGCESCGGGGGYCYQAPLDGHMISVCGCHRACP
jgi:hypothetical protein